MVQMPLDITCSNCFLTLSLISTCCLPDLETDPDDRYRCAQDNLDEQVHVASSSSSVSKYDIYKDATPPVNGLEYRRTMAMYVPQLRCQQSESDGKLLRHGIRMRFQGNGGHQLLAHTCTILSFSLTMIISLLSHLFQICFCGWQIK